MNDAPPTDIASTLQRLGALLQREAYEEAAHFAAAARRDFPVSAELIRLHGVALLRLGHRKDAAVAFHRAAEIAPDNVELQCNLASLAMADGKTGAAIERLQRALQRTPGHPALLQALGAAHMSIGQHTQGRDALAQALRSFPDHPAIRLNLAAAEMELGRLAEAEALVRQVLQQVPEASTAHAMLGHLLHMRRLPQEAAASLLRAGKLAPGNVQYLFQAGLMFDEAGDLASAHEAFGQALARAPESVPVTGQLLLARRRLCRWQDLDALHERVLRAVSEGTPGIHPFAFLAEGTDAALQLRCARTHAGLIERQADAFRQQLALRHALPLPETPVRVGLLGEGFRDTAAGHHLVALLEALAESELDIHLFATTPDDGSALRRRLAATATLHDVSALNRMEVARLIHGTAIEVLIDLNGYRSLGHGELMALRPAPVQVGWLGYTCSSGAPWMDYLLTDAITLPRELREHVTEKVVRLPRCQQPNDPQRTHAPIPTRAACGLPQDAVVFGCFVDTQMMNPAVFARCMLILQQVPDSVLWLLSGPADADERLRQAAQAVGVEPGRLVFMPRVSYPEYLACFAHVDLYLDTLPVNARAAASDALRSGCPVLTRTGDAMAGRTVTSLLHHLGLDELISADDDAFIAMATELGRDKAALATLREHLLQEHARHPLFDMRGFAADFRRALLAMSARYRIGRPPSDIDL